MRELHDLLECVSMYEYDFAREEIILPDESGDARSWLYALAAAEAGIGDYRNDYDSGVLLLERLSAGPAASLLSEHSRARALYLRALEAVGENSPRYRDWLNSPQCSDPIAEQGNARWFLDIAIDCVRRMSAEERAAFPTEERDFTALHFGFGAMLRNLYLSGHRRHALLFDSGADNVIRRIAAILAPEYDFLRCAPGNPAQEHIARIEKLRALEPALRERMLVPSDYDRMTAWKRDPLPEAIPVNAQPAAAETAMRLSARDRAAARQLALRLHRRLGGMLEDPMPALAFRVTLGELPDGEASLHRAAASLEAYRGRCAGGMIFLAPDRLVCLRSRCIALLLRPRGLEDIGRLNDICGQVGARMPAQAQIPHIVLARLRPGTADGVRLQRALAEETPGLDPLRLPVASLTCLRPEDANHPADVPLSVCFCCDDGRRSMMAAALLNAKARERGLAVRGEARRAFLSPGEAFPDALREAPDRRGMPGEDWREPSTLAAGEDTAFSQYAMMSFGALFAARRQGLPEDRTEAASRAFYGVKIPEEGGWQDIFKAISQRVERYLDDLARKEDPS